MIVVRAAPRLFNRPESQVLVESGDRGARSRSTTLKNSLRLAEKVIWSVRYSATDLYLASAEVTGTIAPRVLLPGFSEL